MTEKFLRQPISLLLQASADTVDQGHPLALQLLPCRQQLAKLPDVSIDDVHLPRQQVTPGQPDQPLWNPEFPGHDFDVIDGLTYEIDLTRPARFRPSGALATVRGQRIVRLHLDGQALNDTDEVILAVNSFRAFGGGPYLSHPDHRVIFRGTTPIRDHLSAFLRRTGPGSGSPRRIWRFAAVPDTSVLFETGPGIRAYPKDLARIRAEDLGDTEDGFARLRLRL